MRRTRTVTHRLKASRANSLALARAARQQQVQAAAVLAAMSEEIPAANIRAHPGAAAVQSKADEGGGGVQTKEAEALQQQPAPAASSCPLASFFAADQSAGPYRFFTSTGPSFGTMPHPEAQDQWPAPTAAGACPLLVGAHPAEACARTQPPILRQPPMTLEFPPATVSSPAPVSATAAPSGPGSAAAAAAAASAPPRVPPPPLLTSPSVLSQQALATAAHIMRRQMVHHLLGLPPSEQMSWLTKRGQGQLNGLAHQEGSGPAKWTGSPRGVRAS